MVTAKLGNIFRSEASYDCSSFLLGKFSSTNYLLYWQHQKSGRWPAPLVTPKLTQRCPMTPKLLITQTKHMGHWVKGVCCVWQDTFTDRDLQTQGPGREGQWKWTFSLYTTSHHTAWGHLLSRVGHSAHSEKCAQLGFREFWVNWSITWQQNKKCRYFLGMNGLAIAEEIKSWNYFFILSWRTFQEGVKNYMLLVL